MNEKSLSAPILSKKWTPEEESRALEDYEEAITTHNTLINLLPENPDYFAERGLTYHMIKAEREALADFSRAIELDSLNGYRFSSRAFIKDFYGDLDGAVEDYNKAIELDPEDAISLNNLGVLEEKLGRHEKAQENYLRSDKITGVDSKLKDIAENPPYEVNLKPSTQEVKESGWENFLATLKSILLSGKERKAFFRFLIGKK